MTICASFKVRTISKDELHSSFVSFCERRRDAYASTHQQVFGSDLRKYLPEGRKGAFVVRRVGKELNHRRVLRFHPLREVRAEFERQTGLGPEIWD